MELVCHCAEGAPLGLKSTCVTWSQAENVDKASRDGWFTHEVDHITWHEPDDDDDEDDEDDEVGYFDKDDFGSEACVDSPNAPVGVLMYDPKDFGEYCYFCTTKGSVGFTSDIPSADTCVCSGGGACTVFSLV